MNVIKLHFFFLTHPVGSLKTAGYNLKIISRYHNIKIRIKIGKSPIVLFLLSVLFIILQVSECNVYNREMLVYDSVFGETLYIWTLSVSFSFFLLSLDFSFVNAIISYYCDFQLCEVGILKVSSKEVSPNLNCKLKKMFCS